MPQRASNDIYEQVFADALQRARERWPGLRHIAFGDLFLADIRAYREALCARLGWTPLFPLFGSDTAALARADDRRRPARDAVLRGYAATRCGVQRPRVRCSVA